MTDFPTASEFTGNLELDGLLELLRNRRAVVLSGAGCSTESGIPDYRGPDGRLRKRLPMKYQEFVRSQEARARYWSRSAVGWERFRSARPNTAHRALARLERLGVVRGIITQNVDGLHQAAGSRRVLELHGSLARVRCLQCCREVSRERLQRRIRALNPHHGHGPVPLAPDGDAELPAGTEENFAVPECELCGGVLKPDVVFFGENVPKARVERAWRLFQKGAVLLVVGSSLTVFSGRRFVLRAEEEGRPVGIVNLGPTRADEVARVKVEGSAGQVLSALVTRLDGSGFAAEYGEARSDGVAG